MKFSELKALRDDTIDGDLILSDFTPEEMDDPTAAPVLADCIDQKGNVHVVSINNIDKAVEEGVASEDDAGAVTLKKNTWSVLDGMTVSNYGKGFSLADRKFAKRK